MHAAEPNRPDVAKARAEWREGQSSLNPGKLIFIDETATKTSLVRLYGRSLRGARLVDTSPHSHWKTSTFIAGLREDGLIAPAVFDGAINGELFLAYVEQFPGANPQARRHRDDGQPDLAQKTRRAQGDRGGGSDRARFLPAYNPDLNPIEQVIRQDKGAPTGQRSRTVDGLWNALGAITGCPPRAMPRNGN